MLLVHLHKPSSESHPAPNTETALKVMMLVSSYPRGPADSASIFLRNLAESLRDRGLAVTVLAPADDKSGITSESDITVQRFRYFPRSWQKLAYGSGILPNLKRNPMLWLQVPFFLACMTISLLRSLNRVRPDVVHAHWVIPQGLIAILAKFFYKTPTVITLHGGDAFAFTNKSLQKLKQYALRKCDAWTTNTRTTSSAIGNSQLMPEPYVIPMGVDVDRFASGNRDRLRADLDHDTKIVLFVGRLVEKKGVDDLITAFSLLPARVRETALLWIVGDGELRQQLEAHAQRLGVADDTKFWGRIANDQLPDYYAAGDIFVGPSVVAESGDTEGLGVVFLEAFAARLCVLATRAGGINEVIEDGTTGMLVEPNNPPSLAQMMAALLCDKELRARLTAKAFAEVQEKYQWPRIALQFESVYRRICQRH